MRLYHGTDSLAATLIRREGLRLSTSGFGQTALVGAALQECPEEASRYLGDRKHAPVVLSFWVSIVNPYVIEDVEHWRHLRLSEMRTLFRDHKQAWRVAVDDDLYWTKYLQTRGYDAAIIPSTLVKGGGREVVLFDPSKAVLECAH